MLIPSYVDKLAAARAWMAARGVRQLGTEHLQPRNTVNLRTRGDASRPALLRLQAG